MRILIVGCGAVGGYFGGRLMEKGEDVTFLVREGRKKQLEETGLNIKSMYGDFSLTPKTILATDRVPAFELIILSTKSYHFEQAIKDITPFVGPDTVIMPLLNGMVHVDRLQGIFTYSKVIGGLCMIGATIDDKGTIIHMGSSHLLNYGELSGEKTERIEEIEQTFSGTKADFIRNDNILRAMWHKYLFITGLSGVTTLFRSKIGKIKKTEYGEKIIEAVFKEIASIIRAEKAPIDDGVEFEQINQLTEEMGSSMLRDMEKGGAVEADHIQGYLLKLAEKHRIEATYLKIIYTNLKTYESSVKGL
ncbi:ketopantoate reductase family protein [Metabacillus fastidiosus]|uniref:ketopantoate reductase family protein n=1 Tax=Metabacillus fastidiosus TaxID=1458 RepID=UPI002E21B5E1|nr:ketopantoate reductase family protein [Metabacillus fastidiosus]